MNQNPLRHQPLREELTTEQQLRRRTLKAFLGFGLAGLVPFGVWKWLGSQPNDAGIRAPLRRVLEGNERIAQRLLFSPHHLAPTYPPEKAAPRPRVNGSFGLRSPAPTQADYVLRVEQPGRAPLTLSLADLTALPKEEFAFTFKCIEGWSQIQHWGGLPFARFAEHFGLGLKPGRPRNPDQSDNWFGHVGLETPDGGYYVGVDLPSMLHPQTLLAYELNGQPLTNPRHGAPLRLIIPVKYGVKNLKRIGRIFFTDARPRDYWAERGYDYYIGL